MPPLWAVVALLGVFLVTQYAHVPSLVFVADDFVFLDFTRHASFGSLWEPRPLVFHFFRPWSRELHYWALQGMFGVREAPFHIASLGLGLAILTSYFLLADRLAGRRPAAIATAAAAALAIWGAPLTWVAGAQELWMLLFSLLCLYATASGRMVLATAAFALALLSKETAAVLPAIAAALTVAKDGRSVPEALRRTAPLWILALAWAAWHPMLGGRVWHPYPEPAESAVHPALAVVAARSLLAIVNLDVWPRPEFGWGAALSSGISGAIAAGLLVFWGTWSRAEEGTAAPLATGARAARMAGPFGIAWAVLGWLPPLMPSVGWQPYYVLLGTLGAWLTLGVWLARRRWLAVCVVSALALIRPARAQTPVWEWGNESYQRRAAELVRLLRDDLRRRHPSLPSESRLYFVHVPSNIGLLTGGGAALRVWYRDSTLSGGFYSTYRRRPSGDSRGSDFFFRFDSTGVWTEVTAGPEDLSAARSANPGWQRDHEGLGAVFAQARDWTRAAVEHEKLATAFPDRADYAFLSGFCREALKDSVAAARWYRIAAVGIGDEAEIARRAAELRSKLLGRS